METFPKEYFVEIEGEHSRVGRIVINRHHDGFSSEVDVVFKESKKIWQHVTRIYHCYDSREAIDDGVIALSRFLRNVSGPEK